MAKCENTKQFDAVHKPAHYTDGRNFEPKDVIRDWGLNFNVGSAVKYLSRAGRKDDIVQDLRKAQEFIQFEIDAIEAERKKASKDNNTEDKKPVEGKDYVVTATGLRLEKPLVCSSEDIIKYFVDML